MDAWPLVPSPSSLVPRHAPEFLSTGLLSGHNTSPSSRGIIICFPSIYNSMVSAGELTRSELCESR